MSGDTNLNEDKLLAIEMVGDEFNIKIPVDGLLARHMLEELTHQVQMREITQAWELRKQMAALNGNGVAKATPLDVERFGRHRRS